MAATNSVTETFPRVLTNLICPRRQETPTQVFSGFDCSTKTWPSARIRALLVLHRGTSARSVDDLDPMVQHDAHGVDDHKEDKIDHQPKKREEPCGVVVAAKKKSHGIKQGEDIDRYQYQPEASL